MITNLLQACRGSRFDDGVDISVSNSSYGDSYGESLDSLEHVKKDNLIECSSDADRDDLDCPCDRRMVLSPAPLFKDFLVMYATTPGWC